MNKSTQEIVTEYFNEASHGCVTLQTNTSGQPWKFGVHFFTKIEGKTNACDNLAPEVQIPNFEVFLDALNKYLSLAKEFYFDDQDYFDLTDDGFTKKLISDLFASATNYDLNTIVPYIETRTKLIKNTLPPEQFELGNINGATISATIKKNRSNLEGPYNMEFFAEKDKEFYPLPSVTFGLADNDVYVYAIKYFDSKRIDSITQKTIHTIVDGKPILDTPFKQEMQEFFHIFFGNFSVFGPYFLGSTTGIIILYSRAQPNHG